MVPKSFDRASDPLKAFIHDKSRAISKLKPKIRIIHVIEPEIIKTDVENFRGLVQRLTGKPNAEINRSAYLRSKTSPDVLAPASRGYKPLESTESECTGMLKTENEDVYEGESIPGAFLSFLEDSGEFIIHGIDEFLPMNAFGAELLPLC